MHASIGGGGVRRRRFRLGGRETKSTDHEDDECSNGIYHAINYEFLRFTFKSEPVEQHDLTQTSSELLVQVL